MLSGSSAMPVSSAVPQILGPATLPPDGFDPIGSVVDADRLEEFWLPARPDPQLEPELYGHWEEMFSGPKIGRAHV